MMPPLTVTLILPLHSCKHPKVNKRFSSPLQRNSVLKTTFTLQRTLRLGSFLHSLLCVSCNDFLMQYEICMCFHRTLPVHRMKRFTSGSDGIGSETVLLVLVTSLDCCRKAALAGVQKESSGTFHRLPVNSLFFFHFHMTVIVSVHAVIF